MSSDSLSEWLAERLYNEAEANGRSPLHILVDASDPNLQLFSEALKIKHFSSSVNVRDRNGDTPLHVVARKGITSANIVNELLKAGSNPNVPNKAGQTPF